MSTVLIYPLLVILLIISFFIIAYFASIALKKKYQMEANKQLNIISGTQQGSSQASDRGDAAERFSEALKNQRDGWDGSHQGDSREAFLKALEEGEVSEEEYRQRPIEDIY